MIKCYVAAVFGLVALGLWATHQYAAEQALKAKDPDMSHSLALVISKPISLENGIEANTPFADAVQFFRDRYDLPLVVDHAAFEGEGFDQVDKQPVKLPKMKNVRLSTVLKLVLRQLKSNNSGDLMGATYMVRSDYLEITTLHQAYKEIYGSTPDGNIALAADDVEEGKQRRLLPIVNADFERRPLQEALKELTATSGLSTVIDIRVSEKAKAPVSATLHNVPLDTAVQVLADMADLKSLVIDNVLYVTSKENAKAMTEKAPKQMPFLPGGAGALGFGGGALGFGGGMLGISGGVGALGGGKGM
jgi:hypothetical protein